MNEDGKNARGLLAVMVVVTFLFVIVGLFYLKPDPANEKNLFLIIGSLITNVATVVAFYFGSSSGAKQLVANQQHVASTLAAKLPSGLPEDPLNVTEVAAKNAAVKRVVNPAGKPAAKPRKR